MHPLVINTHRKLPAPSKRPSPIFGSKSCKRPWAFTLHFTVLVVPEQPRSTKHFSISVPRQFNSTLRHLTKTMDRIDSEWTSEEAVWYMEYSDTAGIHKMNNDLLQHCTVLYWVRVLYSTVLYWVIVCLIAVLFSVVLPWSRDSSIVAGMQSRRCTLSVPIMLLKIDSLVA